MSVKDMLEIVSKCSLFKEFGNREKYYVLRVFKRECFEKGQVVIHEGEIVANLYIVASGKWQVFLPKIYRPEEIKFSVLEPGALIGEYSFIDNQPASASVRALETGELYKMSREDFAQIVESSNHIGKLVYKNLLQSLISRLRRNNEERDLKILFEID